MPPFATPVVNSNGELFDSAATAAAACGLKISSNIAEAAKASSVGLYKTAGGVQWAYVGETPDVWPVKPVRSKKPPRLPKTPHYPVPANEDSGLPIIPNVFTQTEWRPIRLPGLEGYEVSTKCQVRKIGVAVCLEDRYRGEVSRVLIDGHWLKCLDLMCLTFIGVIPYGYVVRKSHGAGESLSNVFYEQRYPCKPKAMESE
jgi:hypothetical protein